MEEAYAIPEESTIMSNEIGEEYHDLSSQGEIEVGATLNEQELFLIQNTVKTNSTKIVIENKENSSIKVYLYYSTQPESSIQEMEVDSLSKGVFENLSSAYLYKIGVILAESNSFKIVVSDN